MIDLISITRLGSGLALAVLAGISILSWITKDQLMFRPKWIWLLSVLGLGLIAAQLVIAALVASPDDGFLAWRPIVILATETWSGKVLLVRLGLTLALVLGVWTTRSQQRPFIWAIATANLFLAPFSGHASSVEPATVSLLLHGLHTASVLTWAGSVLVLTVAAVNERDGSRLRTIIGAFSPIALGLVTTGVFTGVAVAYLQIGPAAALFGTPYGQLLVLKAIPLLAVVLGCAAWIRWSFLASDGRRSPRRWLLLETCMCVGMLAIASYMSQSVPGRHDDIVWPMPFRFDWRLLDPSKDTALVLTGHLGFAGAMLIAALIGAGFRRWTLVLATGFAALLIGSLGLAGLVVPAYPTTFATSLSSYSADHLVNAEAVFMKQCAGCHGKTGHGDGPTMRAIGTTAADLTAPHTGDHTAGDMYWWITHGKPDTVMDGVETETSQQERWDLVNYVRLLTNSARSLDVGFDVRQMEPFLPSIDFGFQLKDGSFQTLRDFEGSQPILLVLAREQGSFDRLKEIEAHQEAIRAAGLLVVVACGPETRDLIADSDHGPNVVIIKTGADIIIRSWSYYRRTAVVPDPDDLATSVGHQEYLIDRFGYVRAKWRSDDGMFPSVETILNDVTALALEPRILPSPEGHLH